MGTLTATFDDPPQMGLRQVYANIPLVKYDSPPPYYIDYDAIATEIGTKLVLSEYPNAVNIQIVLTG